LKVGLNLLHLVPGETGGAELYARRLIPALLEASQQLRLVLFTGREASGVMLRQRWGEVVALPVQSRSRVRRVAAEQILLPLAVQHSHVDILHNVFSTAPALPTVPQVTTVHDLIYKRFPETHAGLLSRGLSLLVPLAVRRSQRLIAPSEATKRDLVSFLGADPERIDVTYEAPGLDERGAAVDEPRLRSRFGLGDAPLVLSVSAKRPHKNLERLFEGFAAVQADPAPMLLVTGYGTPFESGLQRRAGERIRFAGWVEDDVLDGLYRIASCLAFPSLAEGFGLPVLEAMRRGLPVVCSNTTSLPEVAGDAALYFDPTDTEPITRALERVLGDPALRERLADAGRAQARKFSWEATALATLQSYELVLKTRA
jgi:glycosyltransferase involved in cell wall biosynthesis